MPEPQDTNAFTMDDFFQKHGKSVGLDDLGNDAGWNDRYSDVGGKAPPAAKPTEKPALQPNPEAESGSDGLDELDDATLKALGLAEPSPDSGADSGDPAGGETPGGTQLAEQVDLDNLARILGIDRDDIVTSNDGLRIRAKVDGETFEVSPAELRKGYQLQSTFTKNHETFLQQQREWQAAQQAQHQALFERATLLDNMLAQDEQALNQEYSRVQWDDLRARDPAEYAATVTEYNQRLNGIRARRHQVVETFRQSMNEQQAQTIEQMKARRQEESRLLAESLGWKTKETWETGTKQLRKYLVEQAGVPEQQVNQVLDHRTLLVAEKARRYDALMAKVNLAKKKIEEVHKTPSGSSSTAPSSRGARNRRAAEVSKNAMARLQKEHSVEAAAEYFGTLGGIL